MTFSITARCARSKMFGVAVSSSSIAVAARCAFVRAGVGAVATQNVTDPRLGPKGLEFMADGMSAPDALEAILSEHRDAPYRQLALVDREGRTANHSGGRCYPTVAVISGEGAVAAGNLLANLEVPRAMMDAFAAAADAHLAERLLVALKAGLAAGGETEPVRSAGLVVADREAWPMVDLRIDWSEGDPIAELHGLWQAWQPRMADYVLRGVDPSASTAAQSLGEI